jgi:hypothetical protein
VTRFVRGLLLATILICSAIANKSNGDEASTPPKLGLGAFRSEVGLGWLSIKKIRDDLQLTDEQTSAIAKLRKESVQELTKDVGSLKAAGTMSSKELGNKMALNRAARENRIDERLRTILNEKQLARASQLALQVSGPSALASKEVADSLKLTAEQRSKLRELRRSAIKEFNDFRNSHPDLSRDATVKRLADVRQNTESRTMEVLSSDQRRQFGELQGPKLDLAVADIQAAVGDLADAIVVSASPDSKRGPVPMEPSGAHQPKDK